MNKYFIALALLLIIGVFGQQALTEDDPTLVQFSLEVSGMPGFSLSSAFTPNNYASLVIAVSGNAAKWTCLVNYAHETLLVLRLPSSLPTRPGRERMDPRPFHEVP